MPKSDDQLGTRMKEYEDRECFKFFPYLPICVRLDGKNFHNYTKEFDKPYDKTLSDIMQETTKFLVEETNACIGYTQSDEVSLIYYSGEPKSQVFFDGKKHKMTSVIASMCTLRFYYASLARKFHGKGIPYFDCRAWQVPNKTEAVNYLIWREIDAVKNSIASATRKLYSHNEVQGKNGSEMQEMLFQKGINWNDYSPHFKRGVYYQRKRDLRKFTPEEIDKLPSKHEAKNNPDLVIERNYVTKLDISRLTQIENRVEMLFDNEDSVLINL